MELTKGKQEYFDKYGEERIIDNGIVLTRWEEDLKEVPIDGIEDVGMHLCEILECKECPVHNFHYDFRVTESDKDGLLCCQNLVEWLIDQAQLTCKDRLEEYRRTVVYEPADSDQASDTLSE